MENFSVILFSFYYYYSLLLYLFLFISHRILLLQVKLATLAHIHHQTFFSQTMETAEVSVPFWQRCILELSCFGFIWEKRLHQYYVAVHLSLSVFVGFSFDKY